MISTIIITGVFIGLTIGAVVGPIGILCLRKSITEGMLPGLAVGLGAALADATYGAIAAFGLSAICDFLVSYNTLLKLGGGTYLLWLGYKTFTALPQEKHTLKSINLKNTVISTYFLTLSSPVTILSFIAIFAGYNVAFCITNFWYATLLTFSVFIGSMIWWIFLSGASSYFRTKLTLQGLKYINKIAGIIISLFGLATLLSVIKEYL